MSLAAAALGLPVTAVVMQPLPFQNVPSTLMQRSYNAAAGARAEMFPMCFGDVSQALWSAFDVTLSGIVTFMEARATF